MRRFVLSGLCLLGLGIAHSQSALAAAPANPNGTWRLFKDSDGRVPGAGAVIELKMNNGSFTVSATRPDETVTDSGTYKVSGRTIAMEFKELDKGSQTGAFTVSADTLILPFPMMSDGKGWSMWMTPAALQSFLAKVPSKPSTPETMPALLARIQKVAEAFGNDKERATMDQRAQARVASYKGGKAEAYYAQAAVLFMKGYYREAWYGFARASVLAPTNAVYLHNLATVLQEIGSVSDARTLLDWVTKNYPNLDPPWAGLGTACLALKDTACAKAALAKAQALAPENGMYDYAMGRVLAQEGRKDQAQKLYRAAHQKGYSGSGKEGAL